MQPLIDLTTKLGGNSGVSEIPMYNTWFRGWANGTLGSQDVSSRKSVGIYLNLTEFQLSRLGSPSS